MLNNLGRTQTRMAQPQSCDHLSHYLTFRSRNCDAFLCPPLVFPTTSHDHTHPEPGLLAHVELKPLASPSFLVLVLSCWSHIPNDSISKITSFHQYGLICDPPTFFICLIYFKFYSGLQTEAKDQPFSRFS